MSKASQPELKKVRRSKSFKFPRPVGPDPYVPPPTQFMDKKLFIHLQGGRKVSGTLRGFDIFLNLVVDDALEESTPAQKHPLGTVVRLHLFAVFFQTTADISFCRSFVATA